MFSENYWECRVVLNNVWHSDRNIIVPETDEILSPIIYILPLQLLAYHLGNLQGIPVSTPHYIAKSATTF